MNNIREVTTAHGVFRIGDLAAIEVAGRIVAPASAIIRFGVRPDGKELAFLASAPTSGVLKDLLRKPATNGAAHTPKLYPLGPLALALGRAGFDVFPLEPGGKKPAIKRWQYLATQDEAAIISWWSEKNYNIGIRCGRHPDETSDAVLWLLGIDYDCKNGKKGLDAFELHKAKGWDQTLKVRTPTGGIHGYYRSATPVGNTVEKLAPGVDTRGMCGYLVGPGSVTADGVYQIIKDGHTEPAMAAAEALTLVLTAMRASYGPTRAVERDAGVDRKLLDSPEAFARAKDYLLHRAPTAKQGEGGDDTTYKVACDVIDEGLTIEPTLTLIAEYWNETKADPPWPIENDDPKNSLRVKVENAMAYRQNPVGNRNPEMQFAGLLDDGEKTFDPLREFEGLFTSGEPPKQEPKPGPEDDPSLPVRLRNAINTKLPASVDITFRFKQIISWLGALNYSSNDIAIRLRGKPCVPRSYKHPDGSLRLDLIERDLKDRQPHWGAAFEFEANAAALTLAQNAHDRVGAFTGAWEAQAAYDQVYITFTDAFAKAKDAGLAAGKSKDDARAAAIAVATAAAEKVNLNLKKLHNKAVALKAQSLSADGPAWRETDKHGEPAPSLHNARLAVTAIAVTCSFDIFHNKLLVGYEGDGEQHVVEQLGGEVSDNAVMALRQILSDQYGLDFGTQMVRDAVVTLALEHMFNPVLDLLEEAEANWDGVKRLDRMAVDYFNCDDTELNCVCVKTWMIAGVARVRIPGCKFDNILVLESEEGFLKSTALEVLAGKENFSDEKIIGKASREVMEALAEVWIHENAELGGMRKAEVEEVKAYASRNTDRARPAYGHFHKVQPRHSVEAATTNNDEYLQSQTGNRRFWGMKVRKPIDIAKLTRDRLQLWGEAAHYQSHGASLVIPEKLWPVAAREQEKRRVKDVWEVALANLSNVEPPVVHVVGGQERVATADLLYRVLSIPIKDQTIAHGIRLANCMRMLGWQRNSNGKVVIEGVQVRGYFMPGVLT